MTMMTGDRPVVIEVAGVCNTTAHQSNYSVKVPYSSMSSTIQGITRQGGKIVNIAIAGTAATAMAEPITAPVSEDTQKKGGKSKRK